MQNEASTRLVISHLYVTNTSSNTCKAKTIERKDPMWHRQKTHYKSKEQLLNVTISLIEDQNFRLQIIL